MRNRIEAGAAVGGLFLALGALAFNQHWGCGLAIALLGCAALALFAAFANRIPGLHHLPLIGAPQLIAVPSIDGRADLTVRVPEGQARHFLLCVGIRNPSGQDVQPAHVNFLMVEGIKRWKCDHSGRPDDEGGWMRPTSERIGNKDPDSYKDYWVVTRSFPGHNSVVWWFRIRLQRPGQYRFRLKIGSSVLYREFQHDFEIVAEPLTGEEEPVEKLDGIIDTGDELVAALDEAHREEEYKHAVITFIFKGRMAIPERFTEIYDDARGDWTGKEIGREYLRGEARAKLAVLYEVRRRLGEGQ
jgi:hypothetical protein